MSYVEFFAKIKSPDLCKVAAHWQNARDTRSMPGWQHIQPSKMAAQLAIIWVYRYDRDTCQFVGRLAGDRIERVFGKSFRGTPMAEIYPKDDYERLYSRAKRVTCEPAFFHGEGMVFSHVGHYGCGERIIMPLSDSGEASDGLLGATVYEACSPTLLESMLETESWFAL